MRQRLAPFTVGQSIGKSFTLSLEQFTANLPVVLAFAAANWLITGPVQASLTILTAALPATLQSFLSSSISFVLSAVASAVAQAWFTDRAAGAFIDPGPGGRSRRILARLPARIGATLLSTIVFSIGLLALTAIPQAFLADPGRSSGSFARVVPAFIASLFVTLLGLVLLIPWSLADTVAQLEGKSPVAALGRSASLAKGRWWRLFLLLLFTSLVSGAFAFLDTAFGLSGSLGASASASAASIGARLIIGQLLPAMLQPFLTAILVIYWLGLRVAKEGLDLETVAASFDRSPGDSAPPAVPPTATP